MLVHKHPPKGSGESAPLTDYRDRDSPPMWVSSVFPHENSLPRAQVSTAFVRGNRNRVRGQDRPDMRGHIVGSFRSMSEQGVPIDYESSKVALEIAPDAGVRILA